MPKKLPTLNLPSADDLFTTQAERDDASLEKVQDISLSMIDPFPDHPFLVKMDESMQAMVDSVKTFGVQTPAVVRQIVDGRYELVSGHRRKMACDLAGLATMPCIVREMSQDEAIIAMVDANLQREVILPSEKARSYKMKLDAMKRQGQRTDLTSSPLGTKLRTDEELASTSGDSRNQIHRFIRLTELISPLFEMVDDGKLAMRPAVELSYIPHERQVALLDVIEAEERAPSNAQAIEMRKLHETGMLFNEAIESIMRYEKPVQARHFKLPREKILHFFPAETPTREVEETIIKALELWHNEQIKPRPE